jgi:hypothetical protein
MAELAQFPLAGGGVLVVETDSPDAARRVMRGATSEAVATAVDTFEAAMAKVRYAAEGILHQLTSLTQPPDEVAVEFGVKLNVETGAIIAKSSAEANFKINLTWKRSAPDGK